MNNTHLVQILVCNQCEPELRAASQYTGWTTFEEGLEALFPV